MKTIKAYYLPATNTKPTRIKATTGHDSIIISDPIDKEGIGAVDEAVKKLCNKLGWYGEMVSGCHKEAYYYNFVDSDRVYIANPFILVNKSKGYFIWYNVQLNTWNVTKSKNEVPKAGYYNPEYLAKVKHIPINQFTRG